MREELSPCQCDIVVETKEKKTTKLLYILEQVVTIVVVETKQEKTTKSLYIEGGSIAQFNTLPRFVRFARQWGNDLSK